MGALEHAAPGAPRPRRCLVAGGAGFLGSHLCERLLARGDTVVALDNLSTGRHSNLAPLLRRYGAGTSPQLRFVHHDLINALPAGLGAPELIFNLACPASPAWYRDHAVDTILTSTHGTRHLLELAVRQDARFLQASTSEVYGDPLVHPQREDYRGHVNPIGERSCYDEGKRCAEAMSYAYARERGVAVRVARLFNAYGPRLAEGDGRVVSNFIVQALAGDALTVYGDGLQTRSFCYVDDTLRGVMALMDSDCAEPVNIGNPMEHTMLELAAEVLRLTSSRSPLRHLPLPADDPTRRCPDIGRARRELGWEPRVPLQEGLQRTIGYFESLELSDAARTASAPHCASIAQAPS